MHDQLQDDFLITAFEIYDCALKKHSTIVISPYYDDHQLFHALMDSEVFESDDLTDFIDKLWNLWHPNTEFELRTVGCSISEYVGEMCCDVLGRCLFFLKYGECIEPERPIR